MPNTDLFREVCNGAHVHEVRKVDVCRFHVCTEVRIVVAGSRSVLCRALCLYGCMYVCMCVCVCDISMYM